MKAIKKVEVVPLDYNIGKIINSASSSDDKTKNTYSMKIIDDKIENAEIYDKATYLQKTSAEATYLQKTSAEAIYLSQEDAENTYLKQTDAETTYKTKGDFAVISGNVDDIPGGQVSGVTVNLPSGFTRSNSFVIGRVWGDKGYVLNNIYGNTITSGSLRMDDHINIHFSSSSNLRIEFYNFRSSTVSYSFKILLMKIS